MTTSSDDMDFERSSSPEILSESEEVPDTFDYVRGNSRSSRIFSLYRKYFDISPKRSISPDLETNIEDFSESIKISNISEENEVKLEENDASSSPKEGDNVSIENNCSSNGEGKSHSFKTKENENRSMIELYDYSKYADMWMLDRCKETPQERYLKNNSNAKFLTFEEFQKEKVKQLLQDTFTKMSPKFEENRFKRSIQLLSDITVEECFSSENYDELELLNMLKDFETMENILGASKNNSRASRFSQIDSNILRKTNLKNFDQKVSELCEHRCEFNEDFLVNMREERVIHNASMKTKDSKNEHPTKITNSLAESSPKKKNPAKENGKLYSKYSSNSFKNKICILAILIFTMLLKSAEFIRKFCTVYSQSAKLFWLGFLFGVCCCALLYFLFNPKDNEVENNKSSDT